MITEAILKIDPNARVSVVAEDVNQITWHDGNPNNITKADIEAQFPAVELDNAMADLRYKRNILLQQTDFHALSDNTMSADMTTYRQELRDLTNGVTTVEQANAVVFPTKP